MGTTKYIFVTGGVVSSVGKGITTAAIGRILKSRNVPVVIQKLDPYLNVDPGTMSPYQHGEVFVTSDGAETDLDLGHYERFLDQELTRDSSVTTGQIYQAVIDKERRGDYLGRTIQPIPHVTNEIKQRIRGIGRSSGAEVVLVEVGGTGGGIEGGAPREHPGHPRDPPALYRRHKGAEDQAHAAQRAGATEHGHPARRYHLPQRLPRPPGGDRQDRPLLRRREAGRRPPAHHPPHLPGAPGRLAAAGRAPPVPSAGRGNSPGGEIRGARGRLSLSKGGPHPRRNAPR